VLWHFTQQIINNGDSRLQCSTLVGVTLLVHCSRPCDAAFRQNFSTTC